MISVKDFWNFINESGVSDNAYIYVNDENRIPRPVSNISKNEKTRRICLEVNADCIEANGQLTLSSVKNWFCENATEKLDDFQMEAVIWEGEKSRDADGILNNQVCGGGVYILFEEKT